MEKMQKELINLNSRKTTFEVEGKVQGETVKGSFTVHFPSIADKINIESEVARRLQGVYLANMKIDAYNALRAACYLNYVLEEKPSWFDETVLDDYRVLFDVYDKAIEFEASFRKETKQSEPGENSKPSNDEETLESK